MSRVQIDLIHKGIKTLVAHWQGMEDGPSAQSNEDYADTASLDCLTHLYDKDVLSRETLAAFAVRLGVLPDAFNYDEESGAPGAGCGV